MPFLEKLNECSRSRNARIFVVVLIVLLCLVGVFMHLSEGQSSSLKLIPKLSDGSLIRYEASNQESIDSVVKKISDTLEPYNSVGHNVYGACNFLNPPPVGKTCGVDLEAFSPCTKENNYGYHKSSPCVFLKLSQKRDWMPEFYNASILPDEMPEFLKQDIKDYVNTNRKNWQMIWLSCEGKNPSDIENIGSIAYLPRRGFPGFFYPCTSDGSCTEPLIAIQFQKPQKGVLINVECRVWAKNLDEKIEFNLLID